MSTKNLRTIRVIGALEVNPGENFRLTDPCYQKNHPNEGGTTHTLTDLLPGTWVFCVTTVRLSDRESRVTKVSAVHRWHSTTHTHTPTYRTPQSIEGLCVDSGQFGIFLDHLYPAGDTGIASDNSTFYGRACSFDTPYEFAHMLPEGIVCRAGFGDGEYKGHYITDDDGKATYVEVEFISEKELEDE